MSEVRLDDLMTVPAFLRRYPDIQTEQGLRWQIFNRDKNGLKDSGAIVKKGGRWFVNLPRYRDWVLDSDE